MFRAFLGMKEWERKASSAHRTIGAEIYVVPFPNTGDGKWAVST